MSEKRHEHSIAETHIDKYLGKRDSLMKVIRLDQTFQLREQITKDFDKLNTDETTGLATSLIKGLGRDDQQWDIDKRDGASSLLQLLNFRKVKKIPLYTTFVSELGTLEQDGDPYGPFTSLMEAGKLLLDKKPFPMGPLNDEFQIQTERLREHTGDNAEREYVTNQLDEFQAIYIHSLQRPKRRGEYAPEYERADITMNEQTKFLYDKFKKTVKDKKTYKLTLWEKTPEFRQLCETQGIPIERFWNLHDPTVAAEGISHLQEHPIPLVQEHLAKNILQRTGVDFGEMTSEQAKIYADEIVSAALVTREVLLGSVQNFQTVAAKLKENTQVAAGRIPRVKHKMLESVRGFFKANGYTPDKDEELLPLFGNVEVMDHVQSVFEERQTLKKKVAAEKLDTLFQLSEVNQDFGFTSRTEEDLYLGDLTSDCTAFHMDRGFNVWTVPIWLSNPGFNFYKISDDQGLVAKLGLLLSVADGKPAIVVDSFETGSGIQDDAAAIVQIKKGLDTLYAWAEKNGMNVYCNTISNSEEMFDVLNEITIRGEPLQTLDALGELNGIAELRKNQGGEAVNETIYLQSVDNDDDFEEFDVNPDDARHMEIVISKTLSNMPDEKKSEFEAALKESDWEKVFSFIMLYKYLPVSQVFGTDYEKYKTTYIEGPSDFLDDVNDYLDNPRLLSDFKNEADYLEDLNASINGKNKREDQLEVSANSFEELLNTFRSMNQWHISPEMLLTRLAAVTDESTHRGLRKSLPLLRPSFINH